MDDHRRRLLALLGTAGVTHLAGCGSGDDGGADGTDDPGTQTETVVPAASQTPTPTSSPTGTPPTDTDTQIRTDTPPTDTDTETPGTPTETPQPTVSKLAPEDGDGGDNFGSSVGVSSDGTTAVIGAWLDEDPNGRKGGSAYVFQWEGEQWNEETKLTPEDGDADDRFGTSVGVSSDGTTAVIGAPFEEDPNGGGAAYVFKESDDIWTQQTKLTADDGDFEDKFGESVVISGDGTVALIGAIDDEDPNGSGDIFGAGSAYVFKESGGSWSQQTKLVPDDGDGGDRFGGSVALSDDGSTAFISAWRDEDPNGTEAGAAYVFEESNGVWSQQTKLTADDGDSNDFFGGVSASDDGTTAVITASNDEDPNGSGDGTYTGAGSAYVFEESGGAWGQQAKLAADDGDADDGFGWSVTVSGDGTTTIIGAWNDEDPNGAQAGSAYVFQRGGGEWSEETKLTASEGDSGDRFGYSVGVSSDGTTAVIGARNDEDPNGSDESGGAGSAYVFPLGE